MAPSPVLAQSSDWQINSFDSDINILEDGKVSVTETLKVNFETSKHGIFRNIPFNYAGSNGGSAYLKIDVDSVLRDGKSEKYTTSFSGADKVIKIGDPDRTITGAHTYTVAYTVTGAILPYSNFDELYWNVTGNDWGVPIGSSTASVSLPKSTVLDAKCFRGAFGSTLSCKSEERDFGASFSSGGRLLAGEGMTIAVSFEKGTVPILTATAPKKIADLVSSELLFGSAIFLSLVGLLAVYLKWVTAGRDFWYVSRSLFREDSRYEVMPFFAHETIVEEYSPPENLRPAQIGVLMDEKADTLDVTATIVDLAVRGYLKIAEIPRAWRFGVIDYELTKTKKGAKGLLPYERLLFDKLFLDGDKIKISSLKRKFYKSLATVKEELYGDVVENKFFPQNPDKIRRKYWWSSFVTLFLGLASLSAGIALMERYTESVYFLFIPIIFLLVIFGFVSAVTSAALVLFGRHMPRRSAHGREMYRRARGYYLFIDKAEKHRQKFFENKNMFNEVLPYAIVFGLVKKFAKAMRDMGIKDTQPTWYSGTAPFNMVVFASSINRFSTSMGSAISSAPRSSGTGGGGFSGGGFGGGGGGSW